MCIEDVTAREGIGERERERGIEDGTRDGLAEGQTGTDRVEMILGHQ